MRGERRVRKQKGSRERKSRVLLLVLAVALIPFALQAGDILRGGAPSSNKQRSSQARNQAGSDAADVAKTTARDRLARTTQAISAVRAMQQGAKVPVDVPNGLVSGGLKPATGANARWNGADAPVQNGSSVEIKQTESQAVMHWENFNVGSKTTLRFDQSAGKSDAGKWIAFNKVYDPSGAPSQILGAIKAEGQVYVINQNGIIFGAGSQINVRTLVASSLPINDNLVTNGLLNNRDAQFLFSGLTVPGDADGTPDFNPPAPPPDGKYGDVVVSAGALIQSPVNADGNGGRVMLVGANVKNEGVISTPSGQTILAAGLQVGIRAHAQDDPSLRGLDVWVGDVGNYGGTATNSGLIESLTGNVTMMGREVNQLGVIDSSTSVALNGRIDLIASYGAVANPNFDNDGAGAGGPPFVNQFTGLVRLGESSVTRILPDFASTKTVPGLELPENSRVNIEGLVVRFDRNSMLMAPSGDVTIRAGVWPYKDQDNNRTVFTSSGTVEGYLPTMFDGSNQRFLLQDGEVHFEPGSLIDVSGTTDVFVPLSQYLVSVTLRGTEFADSPLQRDSVLRGLPLIVDLRRSGNYGGRQWVGTPLGDLNGLVDVIQRDVSQLTARGGTITVNAGQSINVAPGATLDVSGGYYRHEGGMVQTSRLRKGGYLIDIDKATPDMLYDGVYEGGHTETSTKWGLAKSFKHPLAPMGGYNQREYIEGAAGGTIGLYAPALALEGELIGRTIKGPRQLDAPPVQATLDIALHGEKSFDFTPSIVKFYQHSPLPAKVVFVSGRGGKVFDNAEYAGGEFQLGTDLYAADKGGFGHIKIQNLEGDFVLPEGTPLSIPTKGSLVVEAANISINEDITAPGGTISLKAYNFSPYKYQELEAMELLATAPAPAVVDGVGIIRVAEGVKINVSGMMVDDRPHSLITTIGHTLDGGNVRLEGFSIHLEKGTVLDASGGLWAKPNGSFAYGDGGEIAILAGRDPNLHTSMGGDLVLDGIFKAYSFTRGGAISIQAPLVQIGGASTRGDVLLLSPDFFRSGGFSDYTISGLGARLPDGSYMPSVLVASGTVVEPATEGLRLDPFGQNKGLIMFSPFRKDVSSRAPANITLSASGADDPFTIDVVESIGLVVMDEGSSIKVDPGAKVALKGDLVYIGGSIEAPGGSISITGAGEFPLPTTIEQNATTALPTVYIGSSSRLSAAGTTVIYPDPFGRRSGKIYPGGSISISGNIVAEAGSVLDVSGTSSVLDFHPTRLNASDATIPNTSAGLNSLPWGQRSIAARVESDAGSIDLTGSQMLYSDATLLGNAGGPTARGGTLSISSGRFYASSVVRTSADINLIVQQQGKASDFGGTHRFGNVRELLSGSTTFPVAVDATVLNPGIGFFAVDSFTNGGFDSLDLGYKYFADASPLPYGGNVEFRGPVSISARGFVRLAGGGVIHADSPVAVTAPYISVGQEFRPPRRPDEQYIPFTTTDPAASGGYFFSPTTGAGSLALNASLIDVGTLSMQNIGSASFTAENGDIRGNGSVGVAGDLTLTAAQIYPTTLADFSIFAYDRNIRVTESFLSSPIVRLASPILPPGFGVGSAFLGSTIVAINDNIITLAGNANAALTNDLTVYAPGSGSVTIRSSGVADTPLSAGGRLSIYASTIDQGGTLRAPLGSITLGWDGTDLDPSDADLDTPLDPVAKGVASIPTTQTVQLRSGSFTSVSGLDLAGRELIFPFGLSTDGLSWIDPSGMNVTVTGLPIKSVKVAGNNVDMQSGSVVDIRGGGDLLAFRWVEGNKGSADLLGAASSEWGSGQSYTAGDLVTYQGQTWSARVSIDPNTVSQDTTPSRNSRYWAQLPESYAILPGYSSTYAPYHTYSTTNDLLAGDPGYVSSLTLGSQIYVGDGSSLPAGSYTLLPRRYALLPGAYLVNAISDGDSGPSADIYMRQAVLLPEGSQLVSGYEYNALLDPDQQSVYPGRYEIVSQDVLMDRVEYETYYASSFFRDAATRLGNDDVQLLPGDAGSIVFHGNTGLNLQGQVQASPAKGYRGALADISSFADILLTSDSASSAGGVTLNTGILNSWGIESLLVGGLRRATEAGTVIDVRTSNLVLDNGDDTFATPEILLVSRQKLTLAPGASIASSGNLSRPADTYLINGDGTLLRVSGDINASIARSNVSASALPLMTIGSGASISGSSVILDSTYGTRLDPGAEITADALRLGSGQISVVFDDSINSLAGSVVDPHLVLRGQVLSDVQQVQRLTLQSYRSIDLYGSGSFGGGSQESLAFLTSGIRGYAHGSGGVLFQSGEVRFENPLALTAMPAPAGPVSGDLRFDASVIRLGQGAFSTQGYENLIWNASSGVTGVGEGAFTTPGNLIVRTPVLVGERGASHSITSGGEMRWELAAGGGLASQLGAQFDLTGASVLIDSAVALPSGLLKVRATSGDISIGGSISVQGSSVDFYDLVRYADAGTIVLVSDTGDVITRAGSSLSVAADSRVGNAGLLSISTPTGEFISGGALSGSATQGYRSGSFELDTRDLPSYAILNDPLEVGGFFEERNICVRSGNVLIDGITHARNFALSVDNGNLLVTGTIDASGETSGKIALSAWGNTTIASTAVLRAVGQKFSNSGQGGDILIEAGSQRNGMVNYAASLAIQAGSIIDLSVAQAADFLPGDYTTPGSAAFYGYFSGKLHLRAPRNLAGNDLGVSSIDGQIIGASSLIVEGYKLYDLTSSGGQLTTAMTSATGTFYQDGVSFLGASGTTSANYTNISNRLLASHAGLSGILVLAPGIEIINRTGDLTLGTPTSTTTADWNLSTYRFGPKGSPGILTMRAAGDLVFNNALSDGFTPVSASISNGNSTLWSAPVMTVNPNLPTNTQAWSYRLAAGADLSGANFRSVLSQSQLAAGKGSVLVGEIYVALPDSETSGTNVAVGPNGTTENTIQGNATTTATGTRYEVIRTGAGSIDIAAGRDVRLRNEFATIYTAGVGIASPTKIFTAGDFVVPIMPALNRHPTQGGGAGVTLGEIQQIYPAQYTMAGGDVWITAERNIGRYHSIDAFGEPIAASSRQMPTNWLYRRGYVDPATGLFGADGGVNVTPPIMTVTDTAASTTWWVDFSNFFEGVGALGGGDVSLLAALDIVNLDAFTPTNARMAGRDPVTGKNLAPSEANLLELGGGDLIVRAGNNIDGGVYYVERGQATLFAGRDIKTNKARSTSISNLAPGSEEFGEPTWLPTTLMLGKAHFDVSARGNILLGPITNPFYLPQGLNNKFWYKTYFNTFSPDSSVNVSSFGGSVTHRTVATLPSAASPVSLLGLWFGQNLYNGASSASNASFYQPWLRLAETDISMFEGVFAMTVPNLRSTAFAGDVNIVGDMTLFPSATGNLELAASGAISGLQPTGKGQVNGNSVTVWYSSSVNVSDADPSQLPGILSPLAYQSLPSVGRDRLANLQSNVDVLAGVSTMLRETGSYSGTAASIEGKRARHDSSILHAADTNPVRLYSGTGDITGLTLYSPKMAYILAGRDITDISFYLQNANRESISIVSAGRDVLPYNENTLLRAQAEDLKRGNAVVGSALAGDIQINGPGVLEVLAGRNVDLGTGSTRSDGTGTGITSIGNARNPFLPFAGADLIVMAGIGGHDRGPAIGLLNSTLTFEESGSALSGSLSGSTPEHESIAALKAFYATLQSTTEGETPSYDAGLAAIEALFGSSEKKGEIYTRARNIRTSSGGAITLAAPNGGLTMASDIFGNPQTPPGIVSEYGGAVSIFTEGDVKIGRTRIFTLRGGDLTIWSSSGDIAAGTAPKTVVTAPPTRVLIDANSADIQTDLGGLATGGGIGVLASVEGVEKSNVYLIAPEGTVDAGDAGIRATGNIAIAAVAVVNADNINSGGTTIGVPPSAPPAAAPPASLPSASSSTGAMSNAASEVANQSRPQTDQQDEAPSIITVEVLGYGGDGTEESL